MANIPRASLLCFFFAVLCGGGHAHCKSQASTTADVYDVTEYGASTANSDNKDAFLAAWRAACGSTAGNPTLLFPNVSYAVGAIEFAGPCTNGDAPVVVIDGVLQPGGRGLSDEDAWITFSGLNNLLVTGAGTLDGQGDQSGNKLKSKPTTLVLEAVTNSTVSGLWFVNSRGFHVSLRHCSHVVAEGLQIHAPGHGISVGSLGKGEDEEDVRGLVIKNCTVRGTTNGVRIKTWPGSPPSCASNITFEDITMANVSNPIIIDQQYCPHGHCSDAAKPSLVQISDVTFKQIEGTSSSRLAVQLLCSEDRPCTGVHLVDISLSCGDQPCHTEFVNVQGTTPSPGPAARLEEEADVPSGTEQLRQ